jgi:Tol biopolymer transport system component
MTTPTLDSFPMPRRELRDPRTGRTVWQMTDGDFECVAPYMDKPAWSNDDRFLFFMCNKSGSWQPYRLEVATGRAQQLAQVRNALYRSLVFAPALGEVFVEDAGTYLAINPETLAARRAVDYTPLYGAGPGQKGSAACLSGDGRLCVFSHKTPEGRPALVVASTDGRNHFRTTPCERPDIAPGHELICPADADLATFHGYPDRQNKAEETPEHRTAQWRMELDTGRMQPLVLMPPGFRATHCLWGPSGRRFYFHKKTVPQWVPTAIGSVDRDGGDLRIYFETAEHKLGHCAPSPDERWIVTDSQDPGENILMLLSTQRNEQHMLCWPNTSINQVTASRRRPDLPAHTDTHTHPGFSPTGRSVHYTSDCTGRSQVYVLPVEDLVLR